MITRRQHIATVALQLFGDKGFENTSTQQIAKAAGVSEALIFKHFGSKDQLLDFIIKSGYQRIIEHNRGGLAETDPLTFIHSVIDLPYKLVLEEPHFWKLQYRLADREMAQQQHERFMRPVPTRLQVAFEQLGYPEPDKETRLLLLLIEALWKIEANKTGEHVHEMLDFIKQKYEVQRQARCQWLQKRWLALLAQLRAVLSPAAEVRLADNRRKNLVLLATKEHHCLSELLVRHAFGGLNATILAVISNHEVLGELPRKFDLPYHYLPHEGRSRAQHEAEILAQLASYAPDFVVLAKYMRILSSDFVAPYANRLINIHHSFLPAFVGASPYAQAYARSVKIIGATAHFVNEQLDQGPIIAQSVIPIDHTQSAHEMAQAGRDSEKIVLARALKMVLNEQVFVHGNKTIIFD